MSFESYSDQELRDELERRRKSKLHKPDLIKEPDLELLIELCEAYINELNVIGYAHKDFKHFIYKATLETLYGEHVWTFINSKGS